MLYAVVTSGFLSALGVAMLSFSLPLLSLDARISGAWLGTGFAGYFFARLIAGPFAGKWSDSVGPRMPLLVVFGCGLFLPLLYWIEPSVSMLFVVQCLMGIVSGLTRPIGLAVLGANASNGEGARWFRLHTLAFNCALFIGPILGGLVYLQGTISFILAGLIVCLFTAFAVVMVGVPKAASSHRSPNDAVETPEKCLSGPGLFPLLLGIFGRSLGIGLTIAFYPILLATKLGHNALLIGILFSLSGLTVCLSLPLIPLVKKFFRGDYALTGLLLSAVGIFAIGGCDQVWQFVVASVVVGAGSAFSIPETMALASAVSRKQGQMFGTTQLVTGGALVMGPLCGGLMIQYTHDVGLVFMLAGIVGCCCLIPWAVRRSKIVLVSGVMVMFLAGMAFYSDTLDAQNDGFYRYTDVAMGTVVNLTLEAESQKTANDAARKVFVFMRSLQQDLDYRASRGSVGRINAGAGAYFVKPTRRAFELLERTIEFSEASGGVFDPTVGALTISPMYYALDEQIAQSKGHLVDYRRVIFDTHEKRVRLAEEGMALDLGGVAKGAIIDASVKLLRKLNVQAGIVEAGGDFYCFGDRDWKVGVRSPGAADAYLTISVREKGVCGSGDYEQFVKYEEEGKTNLRHHIIDPRQMEPAVKSSGVTVIADSAELADAMATALFIMGPSAGDRFVRSKYPDVSAMWFTPDEAVTATENFPKK